jgi:hypothetical protein
MKLYLLVRKYASSSSRIAYSWDATHCNRILFSFQFLRPR